jgi:hypothetical protein
MARAKVFTEEQIADLTNQLRSGWVRGRTVKALADTDFEQFEQPLRMAFLLAALNATALRDRARDSLARVLRGLDDAELASLGPEERLALRRSLELARPHLHADFLVAVANTLLHIGDTNAVRDLERLVQRSTISSEKSVQADGDYGPVITKWVRTFEGRWDEERDMSRVRTAAHVACERLKLLAEQATSDGNLLHAASAPESEQLVRPASAGRREPEDLLRPEPGPHDSP